MWRSQVDNANYCSIIICVSYILIRAKEKKLLTMDEAITKLQELAKYGRYKKEIIDNARKKLGGN